MKRTALILLFFSILTIRTTTIADYNDELIDIAAFTVSVDKPISEWNVTVREQVAVEDAKVFMADMEKEGLRKTKKENKSSINYSFTDRRNSEKVDVYYNVIVHSGKAELIAVIKGRNWTDEIKQMYVKRIKEVKDAYFTNKAQTFACLISKDDAIINSDYFFKDLTKKFNIQQESMQFDNNENSSHNFIFYGYTPLWTQKINLGNTTMNIQVAVTENAEGHLTYTIGTPILINEY